MLPPTPGPASPRGVHAWRRGPSLRRVTCDHTLAEEVFRLGFLPRRLPADSPWHRRPWNLLDGDERLPTPQIRRLALRPGDTLLLNTDGLTREVPERSLRGLLGEETDASEACRRLLRQAREAGGSDNVTVVVARDVGGAA